ncbi:LCP family protein [uncultured Allofournierella sp.]|uniref:LCP family protein n=1 Tax=uncultured Allofournierella sp. TaxID=1940258 RepID=UPI0025F36E82|nr:LCP family protein [uncultured Fournierella sp.]
MENPAKKNWIKILVIVVAVVLLAGCSAMAYLYSQIAPAFDEGEAGTLNQQTDPDIEAGGDRFYNLLMVGIDYDADDDGRDYAEGKGMTDVIMYVQIDRDSGKVNAFQIPRDTYAGEEVGEGIKTNTGKINEVYANGPDQKNKINNLANKIYELFKLPVDDYVVIDMQAFKTMLNNMGGIEMYVPWDIVTVDKETGHEDLVCPQGTHLISGDTAELILRNRNYSTADYKRLETQQYFYAALLKSFLNDYTLADYYSTCKVVAHYIDTSLDITEIWGLYATMLKVEPENIYIVRAPGGAANINGHSQVYYVDRESCAEILNEHFRSPDSPVEAEKLGLITGQTYLYGMNIDEGRTMGDVMTNAEEGEAELAASSQAASSATSEG